MKYELLTIIPQQPQEGLKSTVERIENLLKENNGTISESRLLKQGRLDYPVRHNQFGHHWLIIFEAEPNKINDAAKQFKLESSMLRFDITKASLFKSIPAKPPVPAKEASASLSGWREREESETTAQAKEQEEKKTTLEEIDQKLSEILKKEI